MSLLDEKGRPAVTERALIIPPGSQLGPLAEAERARLIAESPLAGFYEKTVDRESAYEKLKGRAEAPPPREPRQHAPAPHRESTPRPQQRQRWRRLVWPSDILLSGVADHAVGANHEG